MNVLALLEALIASTLNALPPLVFAALGAVLTERSGVIDIGVEGMMRVGAYFAAVAALVMPTPLALLVGMAAGAGLAAVHALLCLVLRANQVVSGTALNLVALAGITFLLESRYGPSGTPPIRPLAHWHLPGLEHLPLLRAFSGQASLVYVALVSPFVLHAFLFQTALGLRLRAVGEKPAAAASVGISVLRIRWGATLVGGLFAGLAGAALSTSTLDRFEQHMPAGLGFVAIAAVVFGRWTARGAFLAAVFFAAANALRISLASSAPRVLEVLPAGVLLAFPYLLTLVFLSLRAVRSRAPAALGAAYEPERRTA